MEHLGGTDKGFNLLIVTFDPPTGVGGIENRARFYTEKLIKGGKIVELISFETAAEYSRDCFFGATLHRVPSNPKRIFLSFKLLVSIASRFKNVFIMTGSDTPLGLLTSLYSRLSGKRVAVFLYGKDVLTARRKPQKMLLLLASCFLSSRVAANSLFTRSRAPLLLRRKMEILYPGVEAQECTCERDDGKTVLFVGRLVERKGVLELVRAFKKVLFSVPDSRLEIVGDGPLKRRIAELVLELGISDRVKIVGELRGKDLFERYIKCSIFVCPSKEMEGDAEGFGTVFLEAASFSKPSVGTFSGGIPEAVVNGETGILVRQGDVDELAGAIVYLLRDRERRDSLGKKGRDRVITMFSWDRSLENMVRLFSS